MTIPDDLLSALETIPALAARPRSAWQIEQLGGITNRNYRLCLPDDAAAGAGNPAADYVLRLPGAGSSLYLNRPAGIHNAALAAALDIAPAVIFSDAERGWQLSRYLADTRPLNRDDLRSPALRAEMGRLIGRLQHADVVFQHELRPFDIADRYLALAPVPSLEKLRRQARVVEAEIEAPGYALVPAHIDPNPTNFLLGADGRLHLIDWEFSAMADPSWDLAAIALEGELDADAIAGLLRSAGYAADSTMQRRLTLLQCALCLVAASWAYVEIAAGNDDADLKLFAEQRQGSFAARLDRLVASQAG
ncbi:MAG TPA: choline/ethanolamine kinase family protein [Dongiaceae bacterium]